MSRTKAINAKCKDCIYDPAVGGTWREQVELCTSEKTCALWPYRPKTSATINIVRKLKSEGGACNDVDLDALVDGLPDEEDEAVEA